MKKTIYAVNYTYGYSLGGSKYFTKKDEAEKFFNELKNEPLINEVEMVEF